MAKVLFAFYIPKIAFHVPRMQVTLIPIVKKRYRYYIVFRRKQTQNKEEKSVEQVIEVKNLKKYYRETKAVNDISFQVEKGELFGFLGINGAGKSTTISMLCTLFPQTAGTATVCGYEIGKENEGIRKSIGVVYQNNCLDNRLTVRENLMIRSSLYEKNTSKIKDNLAYACYALDLEGILSRPFGKLSGGQKRKCEIARALLNRPEVLFLDEPTTGLDPATRKSVWRSIERLREEENTTVFLTTHYMEEAAKAAHIAIIDEGHLKEFGTPFELKEMYAKDRMNIIPKADEDIAGMLDEMKIGYKMREEYLSIKIKDTLQAIPLLETMKKKIAGFEVVQGSMDDVFLNVTGKELEQA